MARGRKGMQGNVQVALGLVHRKGPPEAHEKACECGVELWIGTDNDVPQLRNRIGRMVRFCPNCRRVDHIWPGPRMLTREDREGTGATQFYSTPHSSKKPRTPKQAGRDLDARGESGGESLAGGDSRELPTRFGNIG